MSKKQWIICFLGALLLSGCASQKNIPLSKDFWRKPQRVSVANTHMEKAEYYQVGQEGILDIAINQAVTKTFREYLKEYNLAELRAVRSDFITRLKNNHIRASAYTSIPLKKLPRNYSREQGFTRLDYRSLIPKVGDYLLIIHAQMVGAVRNYYGFVPIGKPKAVCTLKGMLVDVKTNKLVWRYISNIEQPVDGNWDQPRSYPNFTKALKRAIRLSKIELVDNFFSNKD